MTTLVVVKAVFRGNHLVAESYHRPDQRDPVHQGDWLHSEAEAQKMGAVKCQGCWPEGRADA